MNEYTQHPLSAAFPTMSVDDYQALKDSVENIGVQNPITLFEGMVIDGWHRYSAANELDLDCPSVELGDVDPRDFVLAQNKARRHVTQAQLGLAVTAVYAWKPAGNPAFSQSGSACPVAKTNAELAQIAGVSERTIKQAKAVQTKAIPEVAEAVKRGELGGEKAAAIAQLPKDEQAAAITKPVAHIKQKQAREAAGRSLSEMSTSELQQAKDAIDRTLAADAEEAAAPEREQTELEEARDQIDRLQDGLALALMGDIPEEDREQAKQLIESLRSEIKSLNAQLTVVQQARDSLLNENAAMKQQMTRQRREIDKLKQGVAA